jgi:2-polyprenyl-6-methoxyphenol hydroxylase-like FAD-dependent oxidoreductase
VADAVRAAEPLGPIAGYRYPASVRRHYERLRGLPEGLVVAGDALCSFSPIYAQGMTVAAMQALVLRRCLARGTRGLTRRYHRAAARVVDGPWRIAMGADLGLPEVPGRRSAAMRAQNAFTTRVLAAAAHDDVVSAQFMRVMGLLAPPTSLLRPAVLLRVLAMGGRRVAGRRAAHPGRSPVRPRRHREREPERRPRTEGEQRCQDAHPSSG